MRAEVGPDARIVAANRVRKGGVGGFFAKQAFEVLVEPADCDRSRPQPPDLAAVPPRRRRSPAAARAGNAADRARDRSHAPRRGHAILELADAVSDDERNDVIDLVEERSVSTESHDFAQVLDRFSRSIDATPDELDDDADHRDVLGDTLDRGADARRSPREPEPHRRSARDAGPLPRRASPIEPRDRAAGDRRRPRHDAHAPRAAARRAQRAHRPSRRRSHRSLRDAAVPARACPARLIPRGVGQQRAQGRARRVAHAAPRRADVPAGLGVVIAVVGAGSAPVLLARELASDLGARSRRRRARDARAARLRDPGVAADERRRDRAGAPAELAPPRRGRRSSRAACRPAAGLRWAREMLDDLEPTITWAIVDAGAKREDIAHRVDALGGVDVLALDGLDETVSPAAVLELGIPVGRLGARARVAAHLDRVVAGADVVVRRPVGRPVVHVRAQPRAVAGALLPDVHEHAARLGRRDRGRDPLPRRAGDLVVRRARGRDAGGRLRVATAPSRARRRAAGSRNPLRRREDIDDSTTQADAA